MATQHWALQPAVAWGRTGSAQLEFARPAVVDEPAVAESDEDSDDGRDVSRPAPYTSAKSLGKRRAADSDPPALEWRLARSENDCLPSQRVFPPTLQPHPTPIHFNPRQNGRRRHAVDTLLGQHEDLDIDADLLEGIVAADDEGRAGREALDELSVGKRLVSLGRNAVAWVFGPEGSDIGVSSFERAEHDGAWPVLDLDPRPWTSLSNPILQLDSRYEDPSSSSGTSWLAARTAAGSSFFPLITRDMDLDGLEPRIQSFRSSDTGSSRQADLSLASSGPPRALIVNERSNVFEAHLDTGQVVGVRAGRDDEKVQPFGRVRYAAAPYSALFADESCVKLFDLRTAGDVMLLHTATDNLATESDVRDIAQPRGGDPSLHIIATTRDVLLVDERMPGQPLLSWRHYREQDRTLSLHMLDEPTAATSTVLLWSRRNPHITCVPFATSSPAQLTRSPYALRDEKGVKGLAGITSFSMVDAWTGAAEEAPTIVLTLDDQLALRHRALVQHDEALDDGPRRADNEALDELEARPVPTEVIEVRKPHVRLDWRPLYPSLFGLDGNDEGFGLDANALQDVMAEAEEDVDLESRVPVRPDRHVLSLSDLAALSLHDGDDDVPLPSVFASPVLARQHGRAAPALAAFEGFESAWQGNVASGLTAKGRRIFAPDAPSPADNLARCAQVLRQRYGVDKPVAPVSPAPSGRATRRRSAAVTVDPPVTAHMRAGEACSELIFDLATSLHLVARSSMPTPERDPDASPTILGASRLAVDPDTTVDTLPPIEFGFLQPVRQTDGESGDAVCSPAARLLLSTWTLGEDPSHVEYRDPYHKLLALGIAAEDGPPPVPVPVPAPAPVPPPPPPAARAQPSASQPHRRHQPPPPPVVHEERETSTSDNGPPNASSQAVMPFSQPVPGPFADRRGPRPTLKRKRQAGF